MPKPSPPEQPFRFLLDQNFPEAPIELARFDKTIELVHLRAFDPSLTTAPDRFIYLRAAAAGFHALVGPDWRQINQEPEMLALANLRISVVTWRGVVQDPLVETGQLLAYLPQIKRHPSKSKPRVILLPAPGLSARNFVNPRYRFGEMAREQKISYEQLRRDTNASMIDWLDMRGERERYESLLRR